MRPIQCFLLFLMKCKMSRDLDVLIPLPKIGQKSSQLVDKITELLSGVLVTQPLPQFTMFTEASLSGWGAELDGHIVQGLWSEIHQNEHDFPQEEIKRYLFIRGLIQHEKWQRTRHYLKSAAECTSRAIVSLELADRPVKTVKQAEKLEGIGGETVKRLRQILVNKRFGNMAPPSGMYCSSAGALLVALLEASEDAVCQGHSQDRSVLVTERDLKTRVERLSEEIFLDENSKGVCQAWMRLEVLIRRDLVKRRSLRKSPVYHLLAMGRETAIKLKGLSCREQIRRAPVVNAVPAHIPWRVESEVTGPGDALYTNDNGSDGVILLVDTQEWGGDQISLGQLCGLFDRSGITYKTQRLTSGDYTWIWRCNNSQRFLPHLVERKRADDVAKSLKDGRFWKQITKMAEWKAKFEKYEISCQLHYFLEGEPEQYVVRCADGCQGVGECGNPTITQVKSAIHDLDTHPDFDVQKTDGIEATVILLASLTTELHHRTEKGDFDKMIAMEVTEPSQHAIATSNKENGNSDRYSVYEINIRDGDMKGSKTPVKNLCRSTSKTTTYVPDRNDQGEACLVYENWFKETRNNSLDSNLCMNTSVKNVEKPRNNISDDNEVDCFQNVIECLSKPNIKFKHTRDTVPALCPSFYKTNFNYRESNHSGIIKKSSNVNNMERTRDIVHHENVVPNNLMKNDTVSLDNLKRSQNMTLNRISTYLVGVSDQPMSEHHQLPAEGTDQAHSILYDRKRCSSAHEEQAKCSLSSTKKMLLGDNATDLPQLNIPVFCCKQNSLRSPYASLCSRIGKGKVYLMKLSRQNSPSKSQVLQVCSKAISHPGLPSPQRNQEDTKSMSMTPESCSSMNVGKHPLQNISDHEEESLQDTDINNYGHCNNTQLMTSTTINRYRHFSKTPVVVSETSVDIGSTSQINDSKKMESLKSPAVVSVTPLDICSASQLSDLSREMESPIKCAAFLPKTRQDAHQKQKLALVKSVLPHISETKVLDVLTKHDGNVEHCICTLLEDITEVVDLT